MRAFWNLVALEMSYLDTLSFSTRNLLGTMLLTGYGYWAKVEADVDWIVEVS